MFYIGKHRGSLNDGYISSGKYFLSVYNKNPELFVRSIVFTGSDTEARKEESRRINEAIRTVGYDRIYNLTTYNKLSQWSRTCLHCGAKCCPENEKWAIAFENIHFNNCSRKPPRVNSITPKIIEKNSPRCQDKPQKKSIRKNSRKRSTESVSEILNRIFQKKKERKLRRK